MPTPTFNDRQEHHEAVSDEVHDIITAVPAWIVRWGITLILSILGVIVLLSAMINYPDVVKTTLKVNSLNAPKVILAHQSGKLVKLLVKDGEMVESNQVLAYLESTANPGDVLKLDSALKACRSSLSKTSKTNFELLPTNLDLGELQGAYQIFYQDFLQYQNTLDNGYYSKKLKFVEKDLREISVIRKLILKQKEIQLQEYTNEESEYNAYKKLYSKNVISRSEFRQQENKFLAAKYPLQETELAIVNNGNSYNEKEKEYFDLQHTIEEQRSKFLQALNQCITETQSWILQFVLKTPVTGRVSFSGIVQQNQNVTPNQELFVVNPGNTNFFGEVQIPQYNMGKIREGEVTLVKLHSYPFEQYGMIRGTLSHVSDVAIRDSVFVAKVSFDHFESRNSQRKIFLKAGMLADAEIITEESSLLQKFFRNLIKVINN